MCVPLVACFHTRGLSRVVGSRCATGQLCPACWLLAAARSSAPGCWLGCLRSASALLSCSLAANPPPVLQASRPLALRQTTDPLVLQPPAARRVPIHRRRPNKANQLVTTRRSPARHKLQRALAHTLHACPFAHDRLARPANATSSVYAPYLLPTSPFPSSPRPPDARPSRRRRSNPRPTSLARPDPRLAPHLAGRPPFPSPPLRGARFSSQPQLVAGAHPPQVFLRRSPPPSSSVRCASAGSTLDPPLLKRPSSPGLTFPRPRGASPPALTAGLPLPP